MGVFIDINLNDVGGGKTQINIEVRRKMGAFDQSYEIQQANQHIQEMFNGISNILTNGVPQPQPPKPKGSFIAEVVGTLLGITMGGSLIYGVGWVFFTFVLPFFKK
jgi:hypothetical protein